MGGESKHMLLDGANQPEHNFGNLSNSGHHETLEKMKFYLQQSLIVLLQCHRLLGLADLEREK
jgi:hypothetical protein